MSALSPMNGKSKYLFNSVNTQKDTHGVQTSICDIERPHENTSRST